MERLLRVASPLGLYAEEFDAETGRHLGNFPQAFSHLALIEAAARIILTERAGDRGARAGDSSTLSRSIPPAAFRGGVMTHYDVVIIGTTTRPTVSSVP